MAHQGRGVRAPAAPARVVFAGFFAFLLLSACYSSRQLSSSIPGRDTRIVARVTDRASVEMAPLIGMDAVAVEGIVADTRENGWELKLLRVSHRNGQSVLWNQERVAFPDGSLASVMERRLHTTRTILLAGGITAGAILLARFIGIGGFSSDTERVPIPVE